MLLRRPLVLNRLDPLAHLLDELAAEPGRVEADPAAGQAQEPGAGVRSIAAGVVLAEAKDDSWPTIRLLARALKRPWVVATAWLGRSAGMWL